jgi:hypothetical protein
MLVLCRLVGERCPCYLCLLLSSHGKLIEAGIWAYGHVWKSDILNYGTMWEGLNYTGARPLGSKCRLGLYLPQAPNSTSKYGMPTRNQFGASSGPMSAYCATPPNTVFYSTSEIFLSFLLPQAIPRKVSPLGKVSAISHLSTVKVSRRPRFMYACTCWSLEKLLPWTRLAHTFSKVSAADDLFSIQTSLCSEGTRACAYSRKVSTTDCLPIDPHPLPRGDIQIECSGLAPLATCALFSMA